MDEDFGYYAKTVADRLGVSRDTLRSWAIKLETTKKFEFERNEKKQRIYFEKDIRAFQNMKELLDLQQPMIDVVGIISEKIKNGDFDKPTTDNTEITPSVIHDNTALVTQDQRLEQQYSQLFDAFKMMTSEYAATKEKMDSIEKNTEETRSTLDEVLYQLKKEQEEKLLFKEKLDIAIEFIQKQEQLASTKQKKSLFQRLFGN